MNLLIRKKRSVVLLIIAIFIIVMFMPHNPVKMFVLYDIKSFALKMESKNTNSYYALGTKVTDSNTLIPYDVYGYKMENKQDILLIYNILRTGNFRYHPIVHETPPDWILFTFDIGNIHFYYSMKTYRENLVVDYRGFDFVISLEEEEVNKLFELFNVRKR